ncbi:MAG: bifunctional proline dehydrogenase/L-glutamate gamma-semialdehyde dehydrogenase PutA [Bdellovibrionales bacterium]
MRNSNSKNLSDYPNRCLYPYLCMDEGEAVAGLLKALPWDRAQSGEIGAQAAALVQAIRDQKAPVGQLETFLNEYSLETEEGLALMCLAEALLRIPDKATANALIRDKVKAANWLDSVGGAKDWVVKAAGVGLFMTNSTLDGVFAKIGEPFIRGAMVKAMRVLGKQFVLGQDIEDAAQRALALRDQRYRVSYDMLGEGARTQADADRYFDSYKHAIDYIGARAGGDKARVPGISVKLSALHPRYEFAQSEACVPALVERLLALCDLAAARNLPLTVDAEECARLELSLDVIEAALSGIDTQWQGFGLAVQAYQKRALPLIDYLGDLADAHNRRLQVRLVKGAYWDTEVKRAQIMGLSDFPVFTRKANTDVSYLACAHRLLSRRDAFFPMLATHNAHSVYAVMHMARELDAEFEFQRLYGMGQSLFRIVMDDHNVPVSVYAPVGPHADLLPYLVRRLLENGANTSFVNRILDRDAPVEKLVADPVEKVCGRAQHRHPHIRLPIDLYHREGASGRVNSRGVDLDDPAAVDALLAAMDAHQGTHAAYAVIGGKPYQDSVAEDVINPANGDDTVGQMWPAGHGLVDKVFRTAQTGFESWSLEDPHVRANALERIADFYEDNRAALMALLVREAGKTIADALAEVREAVDFCRYYAARGRDDFAAQGHALIGPTGERNVLHLKGRGVFVCISPWNFPLAIFTGQIAAALMAGNAVIAKPAEQTPLIAAMAVRLMHEAGVPVDVLNLMPGDGAVGAALTGHKDVGGVAFTGSFEVAREINRTLAAKDGAIVPLIAETGGLNAMIVDSSALPEQVIDDVVLSAFGSAGQRCSALRVLCVQNDVADVMIRMLTGAMERLHVGNPCYLASDIGPVIDEEARAALVRHREALEGFGTPIYTVQIDDALSRHGHYFGPCAFELEDLKGLDREVFGPILHVVRYDKNDLDDLVQEINDKGYGLTFGVHSRIDAFSGHVTRHIRAGNVYVNRSMIGAVVGSQPFGGCGLSGTGPKAGGPHYLHAFATEQVISIDTTAAGGNASLVSLSE